MADQSVFKMSGAASEKLAALQNLSYTERSSTYEQDLSKLVCSFMRPVSEVNSVQRTLPNSNPEGSAEMPSRPLPFSIIKPAETWSAVGVRTVADLKTAMSTKKVPARKQQSCDRGVDWRVRSNLYFDFHNERTVRLPYDIPGLAERAESPPLKMEGCTNLTSSEVLNAMRVLEPPKRPSPCKPYTSPRGNSPPGPQGTLSLNNLPVSATCRRKSFVRPTTESPTLKQPVSTPCRKARMKFTKRRSDLEKNPITGLLEPRENLLASFGTPAMTVLELGQSKDPMCENNNNNNYLEKYSEAFIQDLRSEYASSLGSPSSGISTDRRDSYDGSTPFRSESVDRTRPKSHNVAFSESSCQDSVISSSEQNPLRRLQLPNEAIADESQDVEFFDMSIAESTPTPKDTAVVAAEVLANGIPPAIEQIRETAPALERNKETTPTLLQSKVTTPALKQSKEIPIPSGSGSLTMALVPAEPQTPHIAVKQDVATQTQQSTALRELTAAVAAKKPKMIDLVELYKAVTLMKSSRAPQEVSLDSNLFFTKGQLALPAPEKMLI